MGTLSGGNGLGRSLLRLAAVAAMVVASLPGVEVQVARAADPASIHVSITGEWIEFFNFTPDEVIDVSVDGFGVIDSVVAESERFVAGFEFDFEGGQTVLATQAAVVVEVDLVDLSITLEGVDAFGSGPPSTTLFVEAVGSDCPFGEHSSKEVTTDTFGDWGTDFAVECPDGLGADAQGSVFHSDGQGNATIAETMSDEVGPEEIDSDRTLTEDHEGGFVIVADNVTLDCAGHRIYGGDGDGVVVENRTGVTVKNCVIDGFYIGILLYESYGNTIENNVSRYPMEDGHGFSLFFSDGNTLTGNTAISSNTHGYVLVDSDDNQLAGNIGSSGGGYSGFHILGSSDNLITESSVDGYDLGFTIESAPWEEIFHGSDDNTISNNELSNNRVVGFFLAKADGNLLSENEVRKSIIGIGLGQGAAMTPEATNNTFAENLIRDTEVGFANWFNTGGNLVKENKFCHNDLHIDDSNDTETVFEENKFCGPNK